MLPWLCCDVFLLVDGWALMITDRRISTRVTCQPKLLRCSILLPFAPRTFSAALATMLARASRANLEQQRSDVPPAPRILSSFCSNASLTYNRGINCISPFRDE